MPKTSFFERFSKKAQLIAGAISAVLIIGGALVGVGGWLKDQITGTISTEITDFRQEVKATEATQNQAITRLELLNLMQSDPTNVLAIEKLARYYFGELNGDQYMTGKYSDWARAYGGDTTIVIGVH